MPRRSQAARLASSFLLLPLALGALLASASLAHDPGDGHAHGSGIANKRADQPPPQPSPQPQPPNPPAPPSPTPPAGDPSATPPPPAAEDPREAQEGDGKGKDEKPKWDVEAPPGPRRDVPIDTASGTWMSVDVSPDGTELVFDLLGDLYLLPIAGGEARALTAGLAWDEQPRFAPDGKSVAFTSDRSGGDNLWILRLDRPGKNGQLAGGAGATPVAGTDDPRLVQVTKETFRLLNSPEWSPDGQFVVGRKHFTSRRSAGAGEIWIYHRSGGGDGLQIVKRRNDQKDIGEPAFSPDGRYVYYSHDATPGDRFEYSKDPNTQIYAIDRIDRESGEVERWLGGPGGAIRPTLSPDGRWLVYIKRIRYRSTLMLHDQTSGIDRPLWDGLDRDLQEAWAIHGVYPGMSFTPDSGAVVLWAGGGLHRVDVTTGARTTIPFRVRGTRAVAEALRFPVAVAPDDVALRMLRWVSVAPDGKRVVYQALGKLWVKDLPNGTPRRLVTGNLAHGSSPAASAARTARRGTPAPEVPGDQVEMFPSFSQDGRWVVYTTWNDQAYGAVRAVPATGGKSTQLTLEPGHYVEPALSPTNAWVVYRSIGGNDQRGRAWSHQTGVYWKWVGLPEAPRKLPPGVKPEPGDARAALDLDVPPLPNLPATLLTRDGVTPHFADAVDRVYLLRFVDDDHRQLVSLELDGSDERVHADSEAATDFRVSPDGRWLAFRERFNVFVTPFVATGQKVSIGPKAAAMPVARVSKDAGSYLQWSGDSHRLHWSHGPELFERDLTEAFAFLADPPPAGAGGDSDRTAADGTSGGNGKVATSGDTASGDATAAGKVAADAEVEPTPPAKGLRIGFTVPADKPTGVVAFVGGTVIAMSAPGVAAATQATQATPGGVAGPIRDGVVLVEGNRIKAVARRGDVAIPAGAHVVDTTGKTILPGLVDVHWHGDMGSDEIIPQSNWGNYASLAFGVTTLHDPSNDSATIFAASEMARAGHLVAPRIFSTGTILYGAAGDFKAEIDSLEDARTHLRRMQAMGAWSVKSYNQPRRDQRQQVVAAARELGMMVVPEGGSLFPHNLTMVMDGHTGVEHCLPQAKIYDDVLQLWSQSKTGYTPTLGVAYGGSSGENWWYQTTEVWKHPRLSLFVPREILDPVSRRRVMLPEEEANHVDAARVAKALRDRGVSVQLGAHGQREGLAAHWELWMFVQGGMTPLEALQAGTIDGARYLGLDGDIGSLEPGKLADLVVLDRDPLADIRNSDSVGMVMVNGRLYDATSMNEIGNHPRARGPFWWEAP